MQADEGGGLCDLRGLFGGEKSDLGAGEGGDGDGVGHGGHGGERRGEDVDTNVSGSNSEDFVLQRHFQATHFRVVKIL